jgi:DUF2924 family protein
MCSAPRADEKPGENRWNKLNAPTRPVMPVPMKKKSSDADPEREITLLADLPHPDLVACWRSRQGTPPPKGMSRRLLLLALAYRIQTDAFGDLDAKSDRYLRAVASGTPDTPPSRLPETPALKTGMRLMREWNGRTHVVDVTETGLLWNEKIYPSLSAIARAITGARWSGPRFFGLLGKTS